MKPNLSERIDQNERHYHRLKRAHESWRWVRWLQLLVGIWTSAVGIFFLYQAHKRAFSTEVWDAEAVQYYPLGWTIVVVGQTLVVSALVKWRGDPVVALLLKLLQQTKDAETSKESDKESRI